MIGYMCRVDFDHHLEKDWFGTTIYPSIDSLKKHRSCVSGCGIVKVEVHLKEVIQEGRDIEDIRKKIGTVGVGRNPQAEVSDREPGQVGN